VGTYETAMGRTLVEVKLTFMGYPWVVEDTNVGAKESSLAALVGEQLIYDAKNATSASSFIKDLLEMSADVEIESVQIPRGQFAVRTRIQKERDY